MVHFLTRAFPLAFLLALLAPGLVSLLQPKLDILEDENRRAAQWPSMPATLPDIRAYPSALDSYVSDHFGFRAEMIARWRMMRAGLNGVSGSARVLAGEEGWLFLNDEQVVERSAGRMIIEGNAARMLAVAQEAQELALQHEARFAVLPAPNKHSIHTAALPAFAQGAPDARTELDMFVNMAKEAGLALADSREALRDLAQDGVAVYYRGDTHWNDYGAAIAFDEVLKVWGLEAQAIDPGSRLTGFEEVQRDGDLVRFADLDGVFIDTVPSFDYASLGPRPEGARRSLEDRDSQPSYVIDYPREGPVVLVLGDSFTRGIFQPFWRHFAGQIHWMHHSNGTYDRDVFERVKPDFVLFEFVERAQF